MFECGDNGGTNCRWQDRGEMREFHREPIPPDAQPPAPPAGGTPQAVDPSFLAALHACGQTASREAGGRLALAQFQLRGRAGEVAGTDGRQLVIWGGFTLPFQEDLLIPAVPVFGTREIAEEMGVRVGRTDRHVVIAAGPWTVWLAVHAESRFPDVAAVIPRSPGMTRLVPDEADAVALLWDLWERPSSAEEAVPVVLHHDPGPRRAGRVELRAAGGR